ncbi:MAG: DNA translocase FtsK [Clostridiaceae bacterium]|nr:DNA translocase FtsK [Clostridiaceae bacterium]
MSERKQSSSSSKASSKSSAAGTNGKKKSSSSTKAAATRRQKRLLHRTIRAGFYIFMAFLGVLSIFNVNGFLIDCYKLLFGSLIGFGYYLTPPAFLFAAATLMVRMKSKVRLRETAIFFMPPLFGTMGHIVRDITSYPAGLEGLKLLASTGRSLSSGGLIGGIFGGILKAALSSGGGIFFCFLLMAACGFAATGTNPVNFAKGLRPAPEEEYDEPDAPDPKKLKRKKSELSIHQYESSPKSDMPIVFPTTPSFSESSKAVTAGIREPQEPPVRRGFIDFFRKDKPEVQIPADTAPVQKDPTAPTEPTFVTDDAVITQSVACSPISSSEEPETTLSSLSASASAFAAAATSDSAADFNIFTAENPPPSGPSLDEKREAEALKHEKAAEEHDIDALLSETPKADPGKYIYPPLSLLIPGDPGIGADHESIVRCAERLVDTLKSFNIEAAIVNVTKGPTVTRYELQLQRGVKFAKVTSLSDDIALALGAAAVRIAPIPSNNSVGIEVPNDVQEVVSLRDILQNKVFSSAKSKISFAVGKDIAGQCVVGDIGKMPHMLIAGTTGSGKSVCINSLIVSLIYKSSPDEVRLILIDPKMIELGMYNGIPHLLIPVVTDPKKAAGALNWAVGEMMRRYKLLSECNVRSLEAYNDEIRRKGEGDTLPQIVIVIDELADLMLAAAREVEEAIVRIAQMARAAGMHLIIATQRPSADVITGLMKANIPSRIAFAVAQQLDSRIILDQNGAEKLIGRGDMLYNPLGSGKPRRVQGCFISSKEVESVIDFVKNTGSPDYSQEILDHIERQAEAQNTGSGQTQQSDGESDDPMLMDAISVVVDRGEASTSLLQRRLKLGYARAARLIDIMEDRGIVGPFEGSKPRTVSITPDQWSEMQLRMKN